MKKTILIAALSLLLVATFIAPVLAAPPGEQKVPVRIIWAPVTGSSSTIENRPSDSLSHRLITNRWTLQLYIGDSQTPLSRNSNLHKTCTLCFSKRASNGGLPR